MAGDAATRSLWSGALSCADAIAGNTLVIHVGSVGQAGTVGVRINSTGSTLILGGHEIMGGSNLSSAGSSVTVVRGTQSSTIAQIGGILPPVKGEMPGLTVPQTSEYTGSIAWSRTGGAGHSGAFAGNTLYTATITLTARAGFTFNGVPADFFLIDGAATTNPEGNGNTIVVTANFPATLDLELGDKVFMGMNAGAPIEWNIVEVDNRSGIVTLFAANSVASRRYNPAVAGTLWQNSELCEWLNGEFFNNAFTPAERAKILTYSNNPEGNNGEVLLSQRVVIPSSLEVHDNGTWRFTGNADRAPFHYWLRTFISGTSQRHVNSNGVGDNGMQNSSGVRPVIRVLASELPTGITFSVVNNSTHGFGTVSVGYAPISPLTVTIINNSTEALTGLNLTPPNQFTVSNLPSSTLSAKSVMTFTVKPNDGLAPGTYTGRVDIEGDPGETRLIRLNVTFTVIPLADHSITLNTSSHNFTTNPAPATITVTNSSTASSAVNNIRVMLTGINASDFVLGGDVPNGININAGANTSFTVAPRDGLAVGTYTASVVVTGDGVLAQTINLHYEILPSATSIISVVVSANRTDATIFAAAYDKITGAMIGMFDESFNLILGTHTYHFNADAFDLDNVEVRAFVWTNDGRFVPVTPSTAIS